MLVTRALLVSTSWSLVRVSARTRAWERAGKKARLVDAEAADPSPTGMTVENALDAFIARNSLRNERKVGYVRRTT